MALRNKLLVINAGSSSLKFKLFEILKGSALTSIGSGLCERVGDPERSTMRVSVHLAIIRTTLATASLRHSAASHSLAALPWTAGRQPPALEAVDRGVRSASPSLTTKRPCSYWMSGWRTLTRLTSTKRCTAWGTGWYTAAGCQHPVL